MKTFPNSFILYATTENKKTARLSPACVATTGDKHGDSRSGASVHYRFRFYPVQNTRGILQKPILKEHLSLAHEDDVLLMVKGDMILQVLLTLINNLSQIIDLTFNPKKCLTMPYSNKAPT